MRHLLLLLISAPLTLAVGAMSFVGSSTFTDPTEKNYAFYLFLYSVVFCIVWVINTFVPQFFWVHVVGLIGTVAVVSRILMTFP